MAAWLLLLEFTQFGGVCWINSQLPFNQLKRQPLLYSLKNLIFSLLGMPLLRLIYLPKITSIFLSSQLLEWELAEYVCLAFFSLLFAADIDTNTVSCVYVVTKVLNIKYLPFFVLIFP